MATPERVASQPISWLSKTSSYNDKNMSIIADKSIIKIIIVMWNMTADIHQ